MSFGSPLTLVSQLPHACIELLLHGSPLTLVSQLPHACIELLLHFFVAA
jgi:hypothetical protein